MNKEKPIKIGVIGGTGFENPTIFKKKRTIAVITKFGKPSSKLILSKIGDKDIVFLSRHNIGHSIIPSLVPNLANIAALKKLGCTHIIATTACGSLREKIKPGDFVFVDQFIDRTTKRQSTFFEKGHVLHVPMAEPFCPNLRKILAETAKKLKYRFHPKGTVVTIEGPRFSSKAESLMFQKWAGDVINMSTVPEVVLAREAGLHYAVIAMSTDYDCWHKTEKSVDASIIYEIMKKNVDKVEKLILEVIPKIKNYNVKDDISHTRYDTCDCQSEISKIQMDS